MLNSLKAAEFKSNLLIEFKVKNEGRSKGLHQEAALGQMNNLGEVKFRRMKMSICVFKGPSSSF